MTRPTPTARYKVVYYDAKKSRAGKGGMWSCIFATREAAVAFAEGRVAYGKPARVVELPAGAEVQS